MMIKGFWNQINKKHTKYLNLLIFRPLYTCSIDIDGLVDSTITSVPLLETLVKYPEVQTLILLDRILFLSFFPISDDKSNQNNIVPSLFLNVVINCAAFKMATTS
jgi:hypothetical protein